jgi:hypothetical protein
MNASYIQLKYIDIDTLAQRIQSPDATKSITLYTDDIIPLSGQYNSSRMDSQYLLTAVYNNRSPRINPRVKNIVSTHLIQTKTDLPHLAIKPYTGFLSYGIYTTKKRSADLLATSITTKTDSNYDTQSMQDA